MRELRYPLEPHLANLTNPDRVSDKITSNIWGEGGGGNLTSLQFCLSPATLCGLNYLYLCWKERQPMQRKGYNVVNKTGYKRNGKGKKERLEVFKMAARSFDVSGSEIDQ